MKMYALLFILFFNVSLFAQNIYYDSKTINNKNWATLSITKKVEIKISKENADQALLILFNYLSDADKQKVKQEPDGPKKFEIYKAAFLGNPFMNIAGTVSTDPLTGMVIQAGAQS